MRIKSLSLGLLGTNCYIIQKENEAIIIDPGANGEIVSDYLTKERLKPVGILLTHAHFDHIGAVEFLRKQYGLKVYMHQAEQLWLEDPQLNGSLLFTGEGIKSSGPDKLLQPGRINIGVFELDVIHTPGHSPGSISFLSERDQFIISGDTLFQRGIGRTDLPGGNYLELEKTIREKLYTLKDEIIVYPGHGPATTIGEEKRMNPFITGF